MSEGIFGYFTITRAKNAGTKPNPHGGTLVKWYCDFKDDDGKPFEDAYWQRKEGSDVVVGDRVYGKLVHSEHSAYRFYKEKEPEGSTSSAGSRNFGNTKRSDWQPESERDPERAARILRQHSQEMAIRVLSLAGEVPLEATIKDWTDFFDQDVIEASHKAAQGAGAGSPTASPAPAQADLERQSSAEYLTQLLEGVGFTPAQTIVVQRYIETKFTDDERASAEASLKDPERVQWAIRELTKGAEHWSGEPLPTTTPADDDIPF